MVFRREAAVNREAGGDMAVIFQASHAFLYLSFYICICYRTLQNVAIAFMMNELEIAFLSIYLDLFGWFDPALDPTESLCVCAFAVKMQLCDEHLIFLPYMTSNWPKYV
jgi:hypothetical protein